MSNNDQAKAQAQEIITTLQSFISTVDYVGIPGAIHLYIDGKTGIISKIQKIRDLKES